MIRIHPLLREFDAVITKKRSSGLWFAALEGLVHRAFADGETFGGAFVKSQSQIADSRGSQASREAALTEALRVGALAGAGLDVYEREPHVTEGLLGLENVVLAPHLGSATRDTRIAMGMLCVDALRAVLLEGRTPVNVVV